MSMVTQNGGQIIDPHVNGPQQLKVLRSAALNIAVSQTDSAVVAAVPLKKVRVIWVIIRAGGTTTNVTFTTKPAGAGTAISPLLASGVNDGPILPPNVFGWFETAAGEGLSVTTGAGSTTGIMVGYVEVPA